MFMRSAPRPVSVTVPTTAAGTSHIVPQSGRGRSSREATSRSDAAANGHPQLVLAPSGALSSSSSNMNSPRLERFRQLAIAIRQRIETRLAGRVRDLAVRVHGETIVLEGRCATYYTKQLAQHAALGVLDGEPLENSIVVTL